MLYCACARRFGRTQRFVSNLDFLEVGIHNAVIVGLCVGCACVSTGLCTGGLLCGSGCLIHLLEHLAQGFLLCLDVVHVAGLDSGADDYLAKPFGMMEMISRVKAVLRRAAPKKDDSVLKKGDLELDEKRHEVRVHGAPVQLTLKEYELLRIFMKNLGIVFSRDRLLSSVWGIDFVGESRTVDVHIGTLRTKLGDCGDYIETVRGVGYKMEDKK